MIGRLVSWFTGSSSRTQDSIIDGVISAGDKMFFTNEEKAEFHAKAAELALKFAEVSRDESSIRSVTRRILAFAVIGLWVFFLFGASVFAIWDAFLPPMYEGSVRLLSPQGASAAFLLQMAGDMLWIVGAVATFYFGPHMLGRLRKSSDG